MAAFALSGMSHYSSTNSSWLQREKTSKPKCRTRYFENAFHAISMDALASQQTKIDSVAENLSRTCGSVKIRYRMRVSYDGTKFHGWQFQPGIRTVQGTLEKALNQKFKQQSRVVGASRTDAGVHAMGQMAQFDLPVDEEIKDIEMFEFTLNRMLPGDVRVRAVEEAVRIDRSTEYDALLHKVNMPWHAIHSATRKLYSYRVSIAKEMNPFERFYRYHHHCGSRSFDIERLQAAAKYFVGSHDFTSFTNRAPPPPGRIPAVEWNPIRTINSIEIKFEEEGCFRIEYELSGALYRMVRNISGALLRVGCGDINVDDIGELLLARNRSRAPKSAPAQGLHLDYVYYD